MKTLGENYGRAAYAKCERVVEVATRLLPGDFPGKLLLSLLLLMWLFKENKSRIVSRLSASVSKKISDKGPHKGRRAGALKPAQMSRFLFPGVSRCICAMPCCARH